MDVTNPSAPKLAWSYAPPGAASNSPGDASVAVDPDAGIMVTSVFTNVGTSSAPVYDLRVIALNAATGTVKWSYLAGQGANLDGFKAGNPMIDNGVVYVGNPLNATVKSFDLHTGAFRWSTSVASDDPDQRHAPRAAPVMVQGKLIIGVAQHIYTFDPATGAILNDMNASYPFIAFGANQPVIVGNQAYLSTVSGYLIAAQVSEITTRSVLPVPGGVPPVPTAMEPKTADYYDPAALPSTDQAAKFPSQWLSYAGNAGHSNYSAHGPRDVSWIQLLPQALTIGSPAKNADLYGTDIATQMTHFAFGVGSGVAAASGITYVSGSDRTVSAYNGLDGRLIWRFSTNNHNFGQPLVTQDAVIVTGGNVTMNLGNYSNYISKLSSTRIGTGFMYIYALDPLTGNEKWSFYGGQGSTSMTPLYFNGGLYWVDGQSRVWALSASTGEPLDPFMDAGGQPCLTLGGGFNALSSPNVYTDANGRSLMVVGMSMPNRIVAIDLATAQVAWTQTLADYLIHSTGLSTASLAVDQEYGVLVGTTLVDADTTLNTARVLVFTLDPMTGALRWATKLDGGTLATGFVAPTPMAVRGKVYVTNPLAGQILGFDALSGAEKWRVPVTIEAGLYSWAPGALIGNSRLIQPVGADLYTLDPRNGELLNRYQVGGSFTYNHPLVMGDTVYIGNSFGWVFAMPVGVVTGGK
ncbi:MAG: PQQ-binding-like beta-propeller repeat protein [Desulfomicrobium escambiense]|nr:PQQ-binding-like beta-propeller repeat protein [Desulfomicrobium escambiense]